MDWKSARSDFKSISSRKWIKGCFFIQKPHEGIRAAAVGDLGWKVCLNIEKSDGNRNLRHWILNLLIQNLNFVE